MIRLFRNRLRTKTAIAKEKLKIKVKNVAGKTKEFVKNHKKELALAGAGAIAGAGAYYLLDNLTNKVKKIEEAPTVGEFKQGGYYYVVKQADDGYYLLIYRDDELVGIKKFEKLPPKLQEKIQEQQEIESAGISLFFVFIVICLIGVFIYYSKKKISLKKHTNVRL